MVLFLFGLLAVGVHALTVIPQPKPIAGASFVNSSFSAPPSNGPVSKVFVFGRPVLIRKPFVIPQRGSLHSQEVVRPTTLDKHIRGSQFADGQSLREEFKRARAAPTHVLVAEPKTKRVERAGKNDYPLKECYTNDSGFMCCNPRLEKVMIDAFNEMIADQKWHTCNVQSLANRLQKRCQQEFDLDCEALAGVGDFASKAHFYSDIICKIEMQGRFMLAYATPGRYHPPPTTTTTTTTTTTAAPTTTAAAYQVATPGYEEPAPYEEPKPEYGTPQKETSPYKQ